MFRKKKRVRMHLQDAPSIEGVLCSVSRDHYHLIAGALVGADGEPTKLSGTALEVPRSRVICIQVNP